MAVLDAILVRGSLAHLAVVCVTLLGFVSAQEDDFSSPIKCFTCSGHVEDSTCSDPLDVKLMNTTYKHCESGVCLKYTLYEGHKLQMIRGCSADLNFHLTMIDGVCRTERNGNGYLCMCGKNLCNSSPPSFARGLHLFHWDSRQPGLLLLTALVVAAMVVNSCLAGSSGVGGIYWASGLGNVFPVR